MASTTVGLFRALIPALCEETDYRVGLYLDLAAARLDAEAWGSVYAQALCFLAAHLLILSPAPDTEGAAGTAALVATAGGPITSQRAGDLAVSFGAAGGSSGTGSKVNTDADYQATHYGRQFLALRDTRAAGMPTFYGFGAA